MASYQTALSASSAHFVKRMSAPSGQGRAEGHKHHAVRLLPLALYCGVKETLEANRERQD